MNAAATSERIARLVEVVPVEQGIVAEVSSVSTNCFGDYRDRGH
jgi:hypothetical protein